LTKIIKAAIMKMVAALKKREIILNSIKKILHLHCKQKDRTMGTDA